MWRDDCKSLASEDDNIMIWLDIFKWICYLKKKQQILQRLSLFYTYALFMISWFVKQIINKVTCNVKSMLRLKIKSRDE